MNNFDDYLNGKKKILGCFADDDCKLTFTSDLQKVTIEANKSGLICLAKFLIDYAYDDKNIYSDYIHLYPSSDVSLEELTEDSQELIIKKID